jgi:beta-galactosidase
MVRLWTWQAFAHGAEVVSYFRWRQAPFAQEQMHAGLHRPDRSLDQGGVEAAQVARELLDLGLGANDGIAAAPVSHKIAARVALLLDYPSLWMAQIQPQGADFNPMEISFRAYSALRQLGLDVDIVSSRASLAGYALVVLPAHLREDAALAARLAASEAQVVFGPRAGSKDQTLSFADGLPPGAFAALAGLKVQRVASLPPGLEDTVQWPDGSITVNSHWREDVQAVDAETVANFDDGRAAVLRHGRNWYCAGWPDAAGWKQLLTRAANAAGLPTQALPTDVRTSRLGDLLFALNFSRSTVDFSPSDHAQCLLGARALAPQGLAIWKLSPSTQGAAKRNPLTT